MSSHDDRWFPFAPVETDPALRLFCVPHGGSGAGAFRDWQSLVPPEIEVVPVALPGRERRIGEPSARSVERLAAGLRDPLVERADGRPFAMLGHSLGALVAYEMSRAMVDLGCAPVATVVSGAVPPHLPSPVPALHELPDEEFCARVLELGGLPPEALGNRRFVRMILPVLRVDFEATETYECHAVLPDVPIVALGGDRDPGVPAELVARWADLTTAATESRILPGDHFFLYEHQRSLLAAIASDLLSDLDGRGDR